jgi:hypothetical protein
MLAVSAGAVLVPGVVAGGTRVSVVRDGRVEPGGVTLGGFPRGIAVGAGGTWVATSPLSVDDAGGAVLWQIRPARRPHRIVLPGRILGSVALGGGSVWVTNDDYLGRVFEVGARTGTLTRTIAVGGLATGVATSPGAVWVTLADRDLLVRIDPSTGRVVARIRVGTDPSAVVTAAGRVFTANDNGGTVSEVDARSNQVIARATHVGPRASALAALDIADPGRRTSIGLPSTPLALARIRRGLAIVTPQGLIVRRE